MKKVIVILFALLIGQLSQAQELSCSVSIDAQQTGKTQLPVFNDLQRSLDDFINKTKFGNQTIKKEHRVSCDIFITIKSYSSNDFKGSIQVQSSRPVYNSSLTTPIFNYKDDSFDFTYEENQPLDYNPNSYENNLVSAISFYANVILGLDADTFSSGGGSKYFDQADQIASIAEQGGKSGWSSSSGRNSRYELNNQLRSSTFRDYHEALYVYHRQGLDKMSEDVEEGKNNIAEAIQLLQKVNSSRANTLLIRSFFDAKANEVSMIFTDGPSIEADTDEIVRNLNSMAPNYSGQWNEIK